MNVLIVTGIFPPDIGGPATYVPQVAKGLVELGHCVTVLTLSDRLGYDDDDRSYPFRLIRLPRGVVKPWRQLLTLFYICKLGRRADVLFVNGLALESVLANFVLRKPLVMKVVGDLAWERATARGWTDDSFETFQQKRYGLRVEVLRRLRSWWTLRADRIIVPSRYLARWVQAWGVPRNKIAVIYNAVEIPNGVCPAKVPLETRFKVVTVGRLVRWKRVDKIIEAIGQLEDVGLVVVGDGPERQRLEGLAQELQVSDRVYFAGQRCREDTVALMAACDVMVLNSSYEGLPHVVVEAMSLGLPVLATPAGGTSEILEDGLLIHPDAEGLAEALRRLIEDEGLRHRLSRNGRRKVETAFGLPAMVERTEEVLLELSRREREP